MIDIILALVFIILFVVLVNWSYRWESFNTTNKVLEQTLESFEALLDNKFFSVPMFFVLVSYLVYKLLYLVA